MKRKTLLMVVLLALVLTLVTQATAQQQGRGRGMIGDWIVKTEFNGRTMESILAFSRDQDGNPTAQWIGFMGVTDLKDVKFEDGQLSYTQERRGRDGQTMTSTFKGTVADGKLTGTLSSDRGTMEMTGERAPRMPWAVGSWDISMKREEREFNATLVITADEDGNLKGQWQSERGQMAVSDLQLERRDLSFTLKSTNPDRQWETKFEGTLGRDGLTGAFKSERGEMAAQGTRQGADLIGTWNLDIESQRGQRKGRLRINPDMSALYGAMKIEKLDVADGKIGFKVTRTFGDREFEMNFAGKVQDEKLMGEMTTSMGSQKITGTRVVRQRRRPSM